MSSSRSGRLQGLIPALITPFDAAGDIDVPFLRKQIRYLLEGGADGIFAAGGTGEGAYLSIDEKNLVFRTAREESEGSIICAALIGPSTRDVLAQLRQLDSSAVDYVVVTAPFYYAMRQEDLVAHFTTVAEESELPVVAYNIPSATHNPLSASTLIELSYIDNIAGVKDSSGNFSAFSEALFAEHAEDFSWLQGEDYLCGASLLCGADGLVSGLSNARIEPYAAMFKRLHHDDARSAVGEAQRAINDLYRIIHAVGRGNPAIKGAAALAERSSIEMRVNSQTLGDGERSHVAGILAEYDDRWGGTFS